TPHRQTPPMLQPQGSHAPTQAQKSSLVQHRSIRTMKRYGNDGAFGALSPARLTCSNRERRGEIADRAWGQPSLRVIATGDMVNLWFPKPIETLKAQADEHDSKASATESGLPLKRALSAVNLVALGIGAIVGAGIFVLTGQAAAANAGPAISLSFVLGAIA